MHRPSATLRSVPGRVPMHVSFHSTSFEGVHRPQARELFQLPRFHLVRSVPVPAPVPSLADAVIILPIAETVTSNPATRTQALIVIPDIPVEEFPLEMSAIKVVKPSKRKVRPTRAVNAFITERGLVADYHALGQYIRYVLGHHFGQREFILKRITHRLRTDVTCELNHQELFQEEVQRLEAEFINLIRGACWLAEETRQGYGACRLRYLNHEYVVIIDRSKEGPGNVISVRTSAAFRQSQRSLPSLRKSAESRARPRTERDRRLVWDT